MAEGSLKDKVGIEDMSDLARDLDEEIRVQRAGFKSLTANQIMADTERRRLELLESLLKDAIIAQAAHFKKLQADKAARSEINEAYFKLEFVKTRLREAIIDQGARVRKLRTDRATESEIEEAVKRQESLKADFKAATGGEWSEVKEEGPILLTTNKVRGKEVLPEFKERLKELRGENVIR